MILGGKPNQTMPEDITSLQIRVESLEVAEASRRLDKFGREAKGADRATSGLSKGMKGAAVAVGAFAAAGIAADLAMKGLNKSLERAKIIATLNARLKTATGSIEGAAEAMDNLRKFSTQVPESLEDVVSAFLKLKNLGLDPSEEALMSYSNTAAAMGMDLEQFIEAVADASVFEFERLKEFGIKASQQGDKVRLTFQGVTKEIQKDANSIVGYLQDIGNVQFAGAAAEQMDNINGKISNLEVAWDSFWDTLNERGLEDILIDSLDKTAIALDELLRWAEGGGADGFIDKVSIIAETFENVGTAISIVSDKLSDLGIEFSDFFKDFELAFELLDKFDKNFGVRKGELASDDAKEAAKAWKETVDSAFEVEETVVETAKVEKRSRGERLADAIRISNENKKLLEMKKGGGRSGSGRASSGLNGPGFKDIQNRFGLGDEESLLLNRLENERRVILDATNVTEEQRTMLLQQHAAKRNEILTGLEQQRISMIYSSAEQGFGAMADLTATFAGEQSAAYKVLFGISKGFAIAEAAIAIQQNIANASKVGFPQNIPFIAGAISQGASIVSSINSVAPAFERGGIVPGNSFSGDNVNARVNSGEMILNRSQQNNLFNMANGKGGATGSGSVQVVINNLPGQTIQETRTQTDDGERLEFTIKQTEKYLANQFDKGVGPLSTSIQRNTNTRRKGQ